MRQTSRTSLIIQASPLKVYEALTSPAALVVWQVPGNMTAQVHSFDLRVGGGYEMSLFYPDDETDFQGKSAEREDRFRVRFIELTPGQRIRETVNFLTSDETFSGEMMITITLEPVGTGTNITFAFENIPIGIRPEDNEAGTMSSLEKLATYVKKK